jgi:DnaJ-class molecular chaperone
VSALAAALPLTNGGTWIECDTCEGRGGWYESRSVRFEAYDADQEEVTCDDCEGNGGWLEEDAE